MNTSRWMLARREGAELAAILPAVGEAVGGAGAAGGAGASTAGALGAAGAGGAMTGLAGMGPELATASTPAFSAGGGAGTAAAKGGGGDMLKDLGSGNTSNAAMQLMRTAMARQPAPAGAAPGLASRPGSATQPSVQSFLKLLSQRSPATLRVGG